MPLYCYIKKEITIEKIQKPKEKTVVEKQTAIPAVKKQNHHRLSFPKISLKINLGLKKTTASPKITSSQKPSRFAKVLPILFIATGCGLVILAMYPILNWQIVHPGFAPENTILNPFVKKETQNDNLALAQSNDPESDYATDWFPSYNPNKNYHPKITNYSLSIPRLDIENANVIYGAEDLSKSLIGYEGTAIPGEYGNAVIFGHSVLPEFYNPKDYHTIFATLPTLKIGDEIYANVDNVKYKYVVYDFKTVDPTEVSVLEQKYDNYYMSLITCVPPGLKWKRLVVKAKLEPIE